MVTVRLARLDDLDSLCAVLEQIPYDGPVAIDRALAKPVMETILETPDRYLIVAELDGEIVGTVDLVVVPNLTRGTRAHALVENVGVVPAHRRHGIARAMLADAVERARAAGCYKVQLLSNEQRVEAHNLYKSAGFEPRATGFRLYF